MASDFYSSGRSDLAQQIPGLMASEVFTGEIRAWIEKRGGWHDINNYASQWYLYKWQFL